MDNNIPNSDISARRYAFGAREATIKAFDEQNKTQLDDTLEILNKILTIKLMVVLKGGANFVSGPRYDAFALTKSALDVLVSALHMARQRATVETFSLLRIAMEAGSTALHITAHADTYKKYKMGNYKSTTAISFAKTAIPLIGEIWGAFSNSSVHITQCGYGPKLKQDNYGNWISTVTLEYNLRKHRSFQDQLLLSYISLVAAIILKLAELTLFEKSTLRDGWLRLGGSEIEYFSNTDALLRKYYDNVQAITQSCFSGEK